MKHLGVAALLSAIVASMFWALVQNDDGLAMALQPDNATIVATGSTVYREHCAACHGENLEGQPNWQVRGSDGMMPAPPHDPSGHTWHHPDRDLIQLTKIGIARMIGDPSYRSAMPAYEGVLTDEEIIAALSFIKSTWPEAIRERHDQINAQAAAQ